MLDLSGTLLVIRGLYYIGMCFLRKSVINRITLIIFYKYLFFFYDKYPIHVRLFISIIFSLYTNNI
ncbi:hypothetical protein FDZ58_02850 [Ehrlichia ruminantium]|nr:hypothetical protein FDZ68_02840 [Ehrlichia ruminantium]QLK51508.1 hypothetical protein FDZ66_02845 [Ehrlichia ruminantium]QLK53343.1 hypothetical protein FDZ64_02830 [Ehrlichia ruminantium]QLK57014.1 hypothetical protein FDZ60_02850 [Ehrlichia ruminantium]QLK58843.1 hypothetical protein FDZ58_02850 [Ehrlichia ruminantium]